MTSKAPLMAFGVCGIAGALVASIMEKVGRKDPADIFRANHEGEIPLIQHFPSLAEHLNTMGECIDFESWEQRAEEQRSRLRYEQQNQPQQHHQQQQQQQQQDGQAVVEDDSALQITWSYFCGNLNVILSMYEMVTRKQKEISPEDEAMLTQALHEADRCMAELKNYTRQNSSLTTFESAERGVRGVIFGLGALMHGDLADVSHDKALYRRKRR